VERTIIRKKILCIVVFSIIAGGISLRLNAQVADSSIVDQYDTETESYDMEDEQDEEENSYFLPVDSTLLRAEAERYKLRTTPGSRIATWKQRDEFWYADLSFGEKQTEKEYQQSFWQSGNFSTILTVIAIAAFAALLMLYLGSSNHGIFRRNRTITRHEETGEIPEDIFAIAYEKEISRAEQSGDYRLATRLRFLQLLKEMANQNIIRYLDERTNLDYLMQLHKTAWYDDFFRLTRHFEYTWYGLFQVDAGQYASIKNDFEKVQQRFY